MAFLHVINFYREHVYAVIFYELLLLRVAVVCSKMTLPAEKIVQKLTIKSMCDLLSTSRTFFNKFH